MKRALGIIALFTLLATACNGGGAGAYDQYTFTSWTAIRLSDTTVTQEQTAQFRHNHDYSALDRRAWAKVSWIVSLSSSCASSSSCDWARSNGYITATPNASLQVCLTYALTLNGQTNALESGIACSSWANAQSNGYTSSGTRTVKSPSIDTLLSAHYGATSSYLRSTHELHAFESSFEISRTPWSGSGGVVRAEYHDSDGSNANYPVTCLNNNGISQCLSAAVGGGKPSNHGAGA